VTGAAHQNNAKGRPAGALFLCLERRESSRDGRFHHPTFTFPAFFTIKNTPIKTITFTSTE
jgi:hypothetical protein